VEARVVERFWERVERGSDGECWPWRKKSGAPHAGHAKLFFGDGATRTFLYAHRISYELHFGAIPAGLYVLHKCDNPPCCNPAHLFLGTHVDNVRDAVAKGLHARGERSGHAKLTDQAVREIRSLYARGGVSLSDLSKVFGVNPTAIHKIVRRRHWRHVA
jgi:hypothetical protein